MTTLTSLVSAVNTNFHGGQVPRGDVFRSTDPAHGTQTELACSLHDRTPDLGVSLSAIDIAFGHAQVRVLGFARFERALCGAIHERASQGGASVLGMKSEPDYLRRVGLSTR